MAGIVEKLRSDWSWAESVSDNRTKDWLLVSSPLPTYGLVVLYLGFVYYGQRWMSGRDAFSFRVPMLVYNLALVLLSAYMFVEFFVSTVLNPRFDKGCQRVDYSEDALALRLANVCWWFYFSKLIELLDTVIFVLRKKTRQVTFLHVYHHASMPLLWWIGVRWVAGGASYFSGMVNSFVHILMYSYYFLSALGPSVQPYLWWKRYLTSIQLIQFFTVLFHCLLVLYQDCGFPRGYVYALAAYLVSHIILFSDFYNKAYIAKGKKDDSQKAEEQNQTNGSSTPRGRYNLRERTNKTPYKE